MTLPLRDENWRRAELRARLRWLLGFTAVLLALMLGLTFWPFLTGADALESQQQWEWPTGGMLSEHRTVQRPDGAWEVLPARCVIWEDGSARCGEWDEQETAESLQREAWVAEALNKLSHQLAQLEAQFAQVGQRLEYAVETVPTEADLAHLVQQLREAVTP